jgi:hypothetical protein
MNNGINAPDKLPPNLYVIVNNRVVPLPQPKPTAKPNSDVIRPGITFNLLYFFFFKNIFLI